MIGAIIAGGSSTRFGGALKGLIQVGGARIIDRVADALRPVTASLMVISNAPDASTWLPGAVTVPDVRPERGSVVGIHTALLRARDTVMVVAWDMPFVSADLLRLIRDRGSVEQFATVPESVHGLEPFCAMYTLACVPIIEAALDAGALRMSSLLESLPTMTRVAPTEVASVGDPARLFFNVNDAADLAIAERLAGTPS